MRRAYFVHRCSPEIIEEHIFEWSVLSQVTVILYSTDVVEDEATVESVVVAKNTDKSDDSSINV